MERKRERRGLTEEVDDEAAIGQATGGSVKESAPIGKIDGETESGSESTRVRVGIAEHEYDGILITPTQRKKRKRRYEQ